MRILLSSESYWPNKDGGAVFEHWLVHELIRKGHQVAVVAPGSHWRSSVECDGQSTIYRTASGPLPIHSMYKVSYYAHSAIRKALNEFKPDVIHIHTYALTGVVLSKMANKRRIPMVATNHLMPENVLMALPDSVGQLQLVTNLFWKKVVGFHQRFHTVTSPTQSAVDLLLEHGLQTRTVAISNGVDSAYYRPAKRSVAKNTLKKYDINDKPYIFYVGRVDPEKRLDCLVDGFAEFARHDKETLLVIAGKGNSENWLQQYVKRKAVADRVRFAGFISDDDKRELYQAAELFCITSPAELQSIVTLEAAACGSPIVAVDKAALHELCHDGKNGYLVPFNEPVALAKAFSKVVSRPDTRKKFGAYSRSLIEKKHSQQKTIDSFLEVYHQAVADGASGVSSKHA